MKPALYLRILIIVMAAVGMAGLILLAAGPPRPARSFVSSAPTDADIFHLRLFVEPLIPIAGKTTPEENSALRAAIEAYKQRVDQDDHRAILQFLERFPNSAWRVALLTNLGLEYRHTGWFLKALDAWEQAWMIGKYETSLMGKPLVDRAVAKGLQNIYSHSMGDYDFSWNEHAGDTFCVNGRRLSAAQFGNYIAGLEGAAYDSIYWPRIALGLVKAAGVILHATGQTEAKNDRLDRTGMPDINAGAAAASNFLHSPIKECDGCAQ